jgi:hypothetical protein
MLFEALIIATAIIAGLALLWVFGLWWVLRRGRIQHQEYMNLTEE